MNERWEEIVPLGGTINADWLIKENLPELLEDAAKSDTKNRALPMLALWFSTTTTWCEGVLKRARREAISENTTVAIRFNDLMTT